MKVTIINEQQRNCLFSSETWTTLLYIPLCDSCNRATVQGGSIQYEHALNQRALVCDRDQRANAWGL